MGANGNRRQTLRTNIIQPYNSGLLTATDHKDYNAVMGMELDKISTATKHMFQGLDDVRTEVENRTKALDALHLQVNDQFNRVQMEIAGVKVQLGQGITMDSITDADGNVLSGVLQGLKTQINAANGQVMVAIGEISNLGSRFDGEILKVNSALNTANGKLDTEVQRLTGIITQTKNGLTEQIAKAETNITSAGNSITQTQQLIQTLDRNGKLNDATSYWGVRANIGLVKGSFGLYNSGGRTVFTVDANSFVVRTNSGDPRGAAPFSVVNGVTYMNQAIVDKMSINGAQIKNLVVTNANIQGILQSDGYNAGAGWQLDKVKNKLTFKSAASGSRVTLDDTGLTVYDSNNKVRVKVGRW